VGQERSFESPLLLHQTLPTSLKKTTHQTICYIMTEKEKNDKMNSQRTKQHICKSRKPTHDQNLQKSCFLANALIDNDGIN